VRFLDFFSCLLVRCLIPLNILFICPHSTHTHTHTHAHTHTCTRTMFFATAGKRQCHSCFASQCRRVSTTTLLWGARSSRSSQSVSARLTLLGNWHTFYHFYYFILSVSKWSKHLWSLAQLILDRRGWVCAYSSMKSSLNNEAPACLAHPLCMCQHEGTVLLRKRLFVWHTRCFVRYEARHCDKRD